MTDEHGIQDALEAYVDQCGLADILEMLAMICHEKASHLRSNWQDENAAKLWDRDGRQLECVAEKAHN